MHFFSDKVLNYLNVPNKFDEAEPNWQNLEMEMIIKALQRTRKEL